MFREVFLQNKLGFVKDMLVFTAKVYFYNVQMMGVYFISRVEREKKTVNHSGIMVK